MWSRANAPRAYTLCKIKQYHKNNVLMGVSSEIARGFYAVFIRRTPIDCRAVPAGLSMTKGEGNVFLSL
tara:strand:- start:5373 stop:5579 length:207 start_codon:yes stop_codon:yes gene_type:complete